MCGIAGAVGAVVPEIAEAVSRMGKALHHRTPHIVARADVAGARVAQSDNDHHQRS